MARIFTTPAAEMAAKAWMHDVMVTAGILSQSQRSGGASEIYFNYYRGGAPVGAATKICDELINRDFMDIDQSIKSISAYKFLPSLNTNCNAKTYKPEVIAKAIVYMAECFGLYWDDTIRTPYEIDEFKKTLLGNAVYTYGRYISAIKGNSAPRVRTTTSASGNSASAPQNGYKQSGPQSGNVRDLRGLDGKSAGTPGEKVFADSGVIYKIIADKVGKNTPNVFIKPLSTSGETSGTNKIFISSGNGYTDCTCYFDDPNDAQAFLDKIIAAGRVPTSITNIRVVKMKADSNGYFLVGTEFGVCAISAKTLNEAITEALNDESKRNTGWDKATEGYTKKELEELHTWMRRD